MARRFVIRIELTETAKNQLSELSDKNGMTQVSIMSRLVTWFAAQPELIQAAVLGRYPKEIEGDVAKLILKRMAGEMVQPIERSASGDGAPAAVS